MEDIRDLVDRIIADGKITVAEHEELHAAILADGILDDGERAQLDRILELVVSGEVVLE